MRRWVRIEVEVQANAEDFHLLTPPNPSEDDVDNAILAHLESIIIKEYADALVKLKSCGPVTVPSTSLQATGVREE